MFILLTFFTHFTYLFPQTIQQSKKILYLCIQNDENYLFYTTANHILELNGTDCRKGDGEQIADRENLRII